jgi:cold shock CspA family protein
MVLGLSSRSFARDLEEMGAVRRALVHAIHSPISDEEAVDEIRFYVENDPHAAEATLRYVKRAQETTPGYMSDRGVRVLEAAMRGEPPAPIPPEHVGLFERERELGWSPLASGFDQLATAAPELPALVQALGQIDHKSPERLSLHARLDLLVGPQSESADPLLRSALARQLVYRWLTVLEGQPGAPDPERPLWDDAQRELDVRRPQLKGVRRTGTIRWYKPTQGEGRVTAEDGEILTVDASAITGIDPALLVPGRRVSFVWNGGLASHARHCAEVVRVEDVG